MNTVCYGLLPVILLHALLHGARKLRIEVKFLIERNGTLYFRRRVPDPLKEIIGKREWVISLKLEAEQTSKAIQPVERLTKQTDQQIQQAEILKGSGASERELIEAAEQWAKDNEFLAGQVGLTSEPSFDTSTYEYWLDDTLRKTRRRSGKQHEELLEEDDFDRSDWIRIQTVKEGQRLPVEYTIRDALENYDKRHKGGKVASPELSAIDQFIEFAGNMKLREIRRVKVHDWLTWLHTERDQSHSTIQRRLNSIKSIVNHAIRDFELDFDNPFASQKPPEASKDPTSQKERRLPFHKTHLALLEAHLQKPTVNRDWADAFVLMKLTGARPKEILGLSIDDVFLEHDIPFVRIDWTEERRLKTSGSSRHIPIVGDAFNIIAARKSAGSHRLFPNVKLVNADGKPDSRDYSNKLNNVIRSAGIPRSTRLVSYSMRHTLEDALRASGASEHIQKVILGHSQSDMTSRYGAATPLLTTLRDAIVNALPYLGEVDLLNYTKEELSHLSEP